MKPIYLYALGAAKYLAGCTNSSENVLETTQKDLSKEVYKKEPFIKPNEAEFIADRFMKARSELELRSSAKSKTLKQAAVVQSEKISEGMQDNTLMYVFSYTEGFAIVSETDLVHPILAYSDEGYFDANDPDNIGPSIWLDEMKSNLELVIEEAAAEKSLKGSKSGQLAGSAATTPSLRQYYYTTYHEKVGPLLTTDKWKQYHPYNKYTPTKSGEKTPVGCVPLAIAQVVNYYQRLDGEYINWIGISRGNDDEVANLIQSISRSIGMTYTTNGSYPNLCVPDFFCYRKRIERYLGSKGYKTNFVDLGDQYPKTCPAIYEGFTKNFVGTTNWFGGHWWVMDGYELYKVVSGWLVEPKSGQQPSENIQLRYLTEQPSEDLQPQYSYGGSYTTLYLRFNWGQGGTSNGWYGIWDSYTYRGKENTVYSKNLKRLDISPK